MDKKKHLEILEKIKVYLKKHLENPVNRTKQMKKKHLEISENIKKIDLKKKIREYCFCLPVEFSLNELFHGVM